jgi:hypothetical protein
MDCLRRPSGHEEQPFAVLVLCQVMWAGDVYKFLDRQLPDDVYCIVTGNCPDAAKFFAISRTPDDYVQRVSSVRLPGLRRYSLG